MRIFSPKRYVASVDRIDLDTLWADGKRAILLDRDNTLVPRDTEQVPAAVSAWLEAAHAKGFKLCMVSNNWHRDQVMASARELGLEAISHAMKPAPFALKAGLKRLGATADEAVLIGDQLYTDVWSGNLPALTLFWSSRRQPRTCGTRRSSVSLSAGPARPSLRGIGFAMSQHIKHGCDHIFFIGFLGAGKSTLARNVGTMFKRRFIDTDRLVVRRCGKSVTEIFKTEGEDRFRELETSALRSLQSERSLLVSCGGGIVETPVNIELMHEMYMRVPRRRL